MKKILFIAATLFPFFILGQSQDQNYVLTKIYKEPNTSSVANPTLSQAAQNITYFDGLGRPIEQIAHKQSPNGKDLVTHIEYDAFGRQVNEFLPIVLEETLNFQNTTRDNVTGFYASQGLASENSQFPYSYKELEASPLNRVMVQWAPGEKWTKEAENGHPIRFDYQTNINDEVTLFKAATTWNDNSGLYDISLSSQR